MFFKNLDSGIAGLLAFLLFEEEVWASARLNETYIVSFKDFLWRINHIWKIFIFFIH